MKYINKETYSEEALDIVYPFLQEAWNAIDNEYIGLTYEDFRKPKYRRDSVDGSDKIVEIMRKEQDDYCCYCMRLIRGKNITIEHVIPQQCDSDITPYTKYAPVLANRVEHVDVFKTHKPLPSKTDLMKQPHVVAHANLVASCTGIAVENNDSCCFCNGKRGNTRIVPLMLMQECMSLVGYLVNGRMYAINNNSEYKDTIKQLQLNHDRLIEIRHLWHLIQRQELLSSFVQSADERCRQVAIIKTFAVKRWSEVSVNYKKYAESEFYWNLLMDYEWFHQYYKNLP
ncbi:hypothetical protein [Bacteroides sp. UBA939]|uniref:hypothetical protein n=1 Tax=Bacteroides sp. UBA939 TaxID=1946092 RepID=UPI0025C64215|nr:hypothetical protein [Bacteroides sp. UBA939]